MNTLWLLLALAWPSLTLPAPPAEPAKVDRVIAKEPTYQAQPKYCLLVLGPQATFRVWVILDGDTLYMDLNGNGDLTEKSEKFAGKKQPTDTRPENPFSEEWVYHATGADVVSPTGKRFSPVTVTRKLVKKDYAGDYAYFQSLKACAVNDPDFTLGTVHLCDNGRNMGLEAELASRPQDAPVFHVDGPWTFHPRNFALAFTRGDKPTELDFTVGPVSLGKNTYSYVFFSEDTLASRPAVEIEFRSQRPTDRPLRVQHKLEFCCGSRFYGPVRVPDEAGKGPAKVTVSFPDYKVDKILPRTFDVPVHDSSPARSKE